MLIVYELSVEERYSNKGEMAWELYRYKTAVFSEGISRLGRLILSGLLYAASTSVVLRVVGLFNFVLKIILTSYLSLLTPCNLSGTT
jgi:hypothetical protein